jgi:uncharacterized membrane-anchored protein
MNKKKNCKADFVTSFLNGGICAPDVVAVCVKNRHRMISSSSPGENERAKVLMSAIKLSRVRVLERVDIGA